MADPSPTGLPAPPAEWPRGGPDSPWDEASPCWIARAPGRLDVMGGIADYTGGLVVAIPLERGVWVAAQRRSDGRFVIRFQPDSPTQDACCITFCCADLFDRSTSRGADEFAERIGRSSGSSGPAVAGIFHALAAQGHIGDGDPGCTLVIRSELLAASGLGALAATQVAALGAVAAMLELTAGSELIRDLCRHASRTVGRLSIGDLDPVAVLLGRPDALVCTDSESAGSPRFVPVPESVRFVGIDSNVEHRLAEPKRRRTRTAAAMGARIIDTVRAQSRGVSRSIGLRLASISPAEYVRTYRDRLPTRITASAFARRYGESIADADPPEPDVYYRVRSRTEHHIYENVRCHEFVTLMQQAAGSPNADWLSAAGRLMINSHWSYGQRCGLATVQTDLLVNLLLERGFEQGIFGARISGAGGGGLVTVMASRAARSQDAIDSVMHDYQRRTGRAPRLYEVGGCSAQRFGVRRVQPVGA